MAADLDTGMSQGSSTSPAFLAQVDAPSVVNQTSWHHSSGTQEKEDTHKNESKSPPQAPIWRAKAFSSPWHSRALSFLL